MLHQIYHFAVIFVSGGKKNMARIDPFLWIGPSTAEFCDRSPAAFVTAASHTSSAPTTPTLLPRAGGALRPDFRDGTLFEKFEVLSAGGAGAMVPVA